MTTAVQAATLGNHFRKNITLAELFDLFPDDDTAEKWFIKWRWPGGVQCARCESASVRRVGSHPSMPFYCTPCRRYFSAKTNSVMQSSKVGYRKWAIAIYLLTIHPKGISSVQLGKFLGVRQSTAWHMGHRIREAWNDGEEAEEVFEGPVEADECFIGGKERNKHSDKKLRAGGGTAGKVPVAGILDRKSNRVDVSVVSSTNKKTLHRFVKARTTRSTVVYTDEAPAYKGLHRPHQTVKHSSGQYVDGEVSTNSIESFWAVLKRGFVGVYHHMSPKHLHRYAAEFKGRHNLRPLDTLSQMAAIVAGMVGKSLRYADLIAPADARGHPMLL